MGKVKKLKGVRTKKQQIRWMRSLGQQKLNQSQSSSFDNNRRDTPDKESENNRVKSCNLSSEITLNTRIQNSIDIQIPDNRLEKSTQHFLSPETPDNVDEILIHANGLEDQTQCTQILSNPVHETTTENVDNSLSDRETARNTEVQGRRVVDIAYFIQQLQSISNHDSLFNCNFQSISLIGETRVGLISRFNFECNMCKKTFLVRSEKLNDAEKVNVNAAAVTGIISSGIGYSQFEEITACMDIPIFSTKTYSHIQDAIYEQWELTAVESMKASAMRERDAAIAEGRVNKDGVALIDVYADACWSSRSYGSNFKALSGAAAIIGRTFGEVLFIGIKNKYCLVCARAEKNLLAPPKHVCFKNYSGPSSGMESEIITQGFETSLEMYNIIYARLIADGDAATYAKILQRNPYPTQVVQKIECRNHVLRNMCNKLRTLVKDTKYPLVQRKSLTEVKIMSIRKVVVTAIKQYKADKENPDSLAGFCSAVQNSLNHAYGNHTKCEDFYCSKEKSIQSNMEIDNSIFWFRLQNIIQNIISKARSMLEDIDTNTVEGFNSIIAKIVGGKRINFSLRRGYQARCNTAVVFQSHNHPRYQLHKKMLGRSPRSGLKKFEERRLAKRQRNYAKPHKKNRNFITKKVQHDYGAQSTAPDLTPEELERAKKMFLNNLKMLTADKEKIQSSTTGQRESSEWIELRKNMITASNFGLVSKRKENASKAKLVQSILYKTNLGQVTAIAHGVENEQLALRQLAVQENIVIKQCGLFVDEEYPFVGATPDGLVGDDTIVEIKCPITAYKNGLEETIQQNKIQMWKYNKKNKTTHINKNCNWYYQVQGQLHVTNRNKCIFAVWSGENSALKTELITRDDDFWREKIERKLVSFYMNWLLPEIVDSRKSRGLPLREKEIVVIADSATTSNVRCNSNVNTKKRVRSESVNKSPKSLKRPCVSKVLSFEKL